MKYISERDQDKAFHDDIKDKKFKRRYLKREKFLKELDND